MYMKKKIVFLVSHCPDALINKRIEMLRSKYDVTVIYNERGNNRFQRIQNVNYVKLSLKFSNGHLIKRIFYLLKLKKEINILIKKEDAEYIFAFRLDMLILILINGFKRKKIIYEVADLHQAIINNSRNIIKKIIKLILSFIEKKACCYIDILSLTSEKYYDVYFSKFVDRSKVVFMPNIPNIKYFKNYKKINHEEFTIGFIGYVRYKKQMKLLIEAAEKSKIKVFFAGDSQDDEIKELAKKSNYVEYYGKYNYDTEIANLYSKCDCVYSVYDISYNNVKYALPNKLYESVYCELPILVSKGTYLAELVQSWGVGLTVESNSIDDLVDKMIKLKSDSKLYSKLVFNCKKNKEKMDLNIYNDKFIEKLKRV